MKKKIRDFFLDISLMNYAIIEISDINTYSINFEIGIRQAGFLRPILSLSPISIIVSTQKKFNFHRNWKRNVRKAIDKKYVFEIVNEPTFFQINEFINLFNQQNNRKNIGLSVSFKSLNSLLKNNTNYKLFFVSDNSGQYISGRIIYIYGNKSYDVYAANSYECIKNGAAYFIQEKILAYLKSNNIELFDYGRIPPSNDKLNDIYVAKKYSGGDTIIYNGQWIFTKKKSIGLLYEFYKFFILKQRRY